MNPYICNRYNILVKFDCDVLFNCDTLMYVRMYEFLKTYYIKNILIFKDGIWDFLFEVFIFLLLFDINNKKF